MPNARHQIVPAIPCDFCEVKFKDAAILGSRSIRTASASCNGPLSGT